MRSSGKIDSRRAEIPKLMKIFVMKLEAAGSAQVKDKGPALVQGAKNQDEGDDVNRPRDRRKERRRDFFKVKSQDCGTAGYLFDTLIIALETKQPL